MERNDIDFVPKFQRNRLLFVHPTIRNSASTKDFRGSFCVFVANCIKISLNATLAMICLKSEKAKLLRPLTLCRRSGNIFESCAIDPSYSCGYHGKIDVIDHCMGIAGLTFTTADVLLDFLET